MFRVPFDYEVAPERQAEFEDVYGPGGGWARFFRAGAGYAGTTLERVGDGRYRVTDHWESREQYERFLADNADRYAELSRAGERLYVSERRLPPT